MIARFMIGGDPVERDVDAVLVVEGRDGFPSRSSTRVRWASGAALARREVLHRACGRAGAVPDRPDEGDDQSGGEDAEDGGDDDDHAEMGDDRAEGEVGTASTA